jgi:hypothetical protein
MELTNAEELASFITEKGIQEVKRYFELFPESAKKRGEDGRYPLHHALAIYKRGYRVRLQAGEEDINIRP